MAQQTNSVPQAVPVPLVNQVPMPAMPAQQPAMAIPVPAAPAPAQGLVWTPVQPLPRPPEPEVQKVSIISRTDASTVPVFECVFALGTIFICYTIAVVLGHVPIWLPMISDCAVYAPEKYLFRLGMITAGNFICRCSHLIHDWVSSYTPLNKWDKYAVYVCQGSGIFLACVGAINEKEDNTLHSGSAVIFFVCSLIYMWYQALRIGGITEPEIRPGPMITKFSLNFKMLLAVICTIFFAGFVYFSSNWGKYHIDIAFCEWCGTMLIITFYASFKLDFDKDNMQMGNFLVSVIPTVGAPAANAQPTTAPESQDAPMVAPFIVPEGYMLVPAMATADNLPANHPAQVPTKQ